MVLTIEGQSRFAILSTTCCSRKGVEFSGTTPRATETDPEIVTISDLIVGDIPVAYNGGDNSFFLDDGGIDALIGKRVEVVPKAYGFSSNFGCSHIYVGQEDLPSSMSGQVRMNVSSISQPTFTNALDGYAHIGLTASGISNGVYNNISSQKSSV